MPEPASTTTIDTVHQLTGTINLVVLSGSRKLQDSRNKWPLPESGGMLGETCGFLLLSEAVNIDLAVFHCYRSEEVLGVPVHPWGGGILFPLRPGNALVEEVQRGRSGRLQRCRHEPRDAGENEGNF